MERMTPQEALHEISTMVYRNTDNFEMKISKDCYKNLVNALEKQIPKKPVNKTKCDNSTAKHYKNCSIVVCPLCNGRLKLKSKGKHCDKCGQAIDWSDLE